MKYNVLDLTSNSTTSRRDVLSHLMLFPDLESNDAKNKLAFDAVAKNKAYMDDLDLRRIIDLGYKECGAEQLKRFDKSLLAADVLLNVLAMNIVEMTDASLEKAFFLASRDAEESINPKTGKPYIKCGINTVRDAWSQFRPVAHIACGYMAALYEVNTEIIKKESDSVLDLAGYCDGDRWLMWSLGIQKKAFNLTLPRTNKKLLNQDECIFIRADNVPSDIDVFDDIEELKQKLRTYNSGYRK